MVRDLLQLNTFYKRLFLGLVGLLVVFCASYGFLLKQTVAAVVERRSLETRRAELAAQVSVFEARYIQEGNAITRQKASELGFVPVTATRFVSRSLKTFSFNSADESR
jgi:hypothetical protein